MTNEKSLLSLEFDKVLSLVSNYAVLYEGKENILSLKPCDNFDDVKLSMDKTEEAYRLLFDEGLPYIEFYDDLGDSIVVAEKGSTLSMGDLLKVARFLKSCRILYQSVQESKIDAKLLKAESSGIYIDTYLENEIREKILSEDVMSDNASDRLKYLRDLIKKLNEQIRDKLASYIKNGNNKYLQENIITMRGDRYVLPVKSEYKSLVGGFVHDQSATGSTVFIEPTEILELNNSLRSATVEEQLEVEKILSELTAKVGQIAKRLEYNRQIIVDFDVYYAKAIYSYKTKAIRPEINTKGETEIVNGRHPLIDVKKVVPVSLRFGKDFNFLLITGPNTGGKTVTLKMCGLFCLMAKSGIFVPATLGTKISCFKNVFCDVGDEQSIEQNLSTFSSHIKNIIEITNEVENDSLVLIDEIGAGTDPDEGSALARAVIEKLLDKKCFGIITTHYSSLKEFAYEDKRIENASMEFDSNTFAPLYKINVGLPGTSNAIEISKILGLSSEITTRAYELLSGDKISIENVLKEAEKVRRLAQEEKDKYEQIRINEEEVLLKINEERKKLDLEKEKFYSNAKAESRRIVSERLEEADEILTEIKILFDKEELTSGDLIKARTLRNSLEDKKYSMEETEENIVNYSSVDIDKLKIGDNVYYKSFDAVCELTSINKQKSECEILFGDLKTKVKAKDLFFVSNVKKKTPTVSMKRTVSSNVIREINVIGMNVPDALIEVENFIDSAVLHGLEEVKIIHGKGLKILSTAIHDYLRRLKSVESFRFGKYGEGEHGVTFVKLK